MSKPRINHAPDFFRIMRLRKAGKMFREISEETGIHKAQVRQILNDPEVHRQARMALWSELSKFGK